MMLPGICHHGLGGISDEHVPSVPSAMLEDRTAKAYIYHVLSRLTVSRLPGTLDTPLF